MKRAALVRKTPMARSSSPLETRTPLARSSTLKPQSAARERAYGGPDGRRALVKRLLAEQPRCQIRVQCQGAPAVDVHEIKSRARGGSILDASNCMTTCRCCHGWVTEHPAEAQAKGWAKSSWDK